ncbi:hypothetical protein OAB45_01645 [Gammaproteobacteria bacterium]|nr:hypothetical protein [Gammaproteobacteria bacterium]
MRKFLTKYGRHFWILSLLVTLISLWQLTRSTGDPFHVFMFGAFTYYFYLKGTGKLKDEDDPFVE